MTIITIKAKCTKSALDFCEKLAGDYACGDKTVSFDSDEVIGVGMNDLGSGYYSYHAEMKSGERIVIRAKTKRAYETAYFYKPSVIKEYNDGTPFKKPSWSFANGNAPSALGANFSFGKSPNKNYQLIREIKIK